LNSVVVVDVVDGADVLKGEVAWVTGASSGIGKHVAYQLAGAGCKLVLSARSTTELHNVRQQCLSLYSFILSSLPS